MPASDCAALQTGTGLTISKSSWGETSGLYPTKDGKYPAGGDPELYNPTKWDADMTCELRKARAGVHDVAKRNNQVHLGTPDMSDPLEKKLAVYHMVENFPTVDPGITREVKWFYLSTGATTPAEHPGVPGTVRVKTFGPFFNIGGGDVPRGPAYIHYYKVGSNPGLRIDDEVRDGGDSRA